MNLQPNNDIQNPELRAAALTFHREVQKAQERSDNSRGVSPEDGDIAAALKEQAELFGEEMCVALTEVGHRAHFVE